MSMDRLLSFLRAKTGFEFAVYAVFSVSFVHGLLTGEVWFFGRTSSFTVSAADRPLVYLATMAFSGLCVVGLGVSVRAWWRNRGRWFRE